MAGKKFKNKPQPREIDPTVRAARKMRVVFIILSVMIVLSMVLAAVASFY
ncbi:MAG: hypothetical protein HRF47_19125 [Chloroflexota bacterium]|jgi:hypothetical protein